MKTADVHKNRDLEQIRHDLTAAGHQMWLASVGAVAQFEQEGRELFDALVERSRKVETQQFKTLDRIVARTSKQVGEVSKKMQERMEQSARGMLHRLGLPTREDLESLSGRLAALSQKIDRVTAGKS